MNGAAETVDLAAYVRKSAQRCGVRWSRDANAELKRWCVDTERAMQWLEWVGEVNWHAQSVSRRVTNRGAP